jgi:hypothetical protein
MFTIDKGILTRPVVILVYGAPGTGKSELASQFGNTLFLDCESGTDFLNVERIRLNDFEELIKAIRVAATLDYETIVVDSLTAVTAFALEQTLKEYGVDDISKPGYGAGYAKHRNNIMRVINGIDYLKSQKKNVVLLAHTKVRTANDPSLPDFNIIEFDTNDKVVSEIGSRMDAVFYMRHQIYKTGEKASSTGARELITQDRGGTIAKSRFQLEPVYVFENETDNEKRKITFKSFWEKVKSHV